jgi:hypothetical protein
MQIICKVTLWWDAPKLTRPMRLEARWLCATVRQE